MRDSQDVDVLTAGAGGIQRPLLWSLPIAAVVLLADQITKEWALRTLQDAPCSVPDACIDLFAGARFRLVFNTGAAFSSGSGFGPIIGVLALVLVVFLLGMSRQRTDRLGVSLLGIVAGGALGNIFDRFYRAEDGFLSGAVIDFVDLGWWPVFNLADTAIVGGVVALIVVLFLEGDPAPASDGATAADSDSNTADPAS